MVKLLEITKYIYIYRIEALLSMITHVYLHGASPFDLACIMQIHTLIYWLACVGPAFYDMTFISLYHCEEGNAQMFSIDVLMGFELHGWV